MSKQHGVTTNTLHKVLLDSGAVYLNYGEADERLFGATRGGNTYTVEQDVKEMEVDGAHGPVKGGRRIIEERAMLTVNLIEVTADNLLKMLPGATKEDYPEEGAKTHDKITRAAEISTSDYLTNLAILAEVSGADEAFIGIIKNALADGNFELSLEDKDEGVVETQFTAHFDPDDLVTAPWEMRWPLITEGT